MHLDMTNESMQKRVPIRRRVLRIVLVTTLIALLAASVTGVICIDWIRNSSENALTKQLENNLKDIVQQKVISADAQLEHYEKYIEFVTDYIEQMYEDEDTMIEQGHIFYPPRNTKKYMMTRVFSDDSVTEEKVSDEIRFFSNLQQVWEPIAKENEDLITTVYAGTEHGLLSSYDRWSYMSAVPKGEELYYDYYESDWYKQGMKEKDIFFTSLYVDSQGRGLTITIASPFRDASGHVVGVDCADFDITGLYDELLAIDLGNGTFSFALDQDGKIISPDAEEKSFREVTGLSEKACASLKAEEDGIMETKDAVYVSIPIERVGWTLCACVPKEVIQEGIKDANRTIRYVYMAFLIIALLIILIAIIVVNKVAQTITQPMEALGRDMKIIANGDLDYRATVYRNDEIGDITRGMNEMLDRLNTTMSELSTTQEHADALDRLANRDALTGIRNKTSLNAYLDNLRQKLADNERPEFGFAMIDLNDLKGINDCFGHDKGDQAIKGLSSLACDTFKHSPVFRIGGDEFVVLLESSDYRDIASLVLSFKEKTQALSVDTRLDPWDRTSAAIGYALYDEKQDTGVDSVLVRADMEMYRCKRDMKNLDKE